MSSSCADALRLAAVSCVAVAALALAGCGSGNGVARYIDRVNAAESTMTRAFADVAHSLRTFRTGSKPASSAAALARSERTLTELRRRIGAIEAPPAAQHLHQLLLRLVEAEIDLVRELYATVVFVPRFRAAIAPVRKAASTLNAALLRARSAAVQAEALDRYAASLAAPLAVLRSLRRPPVLLRPRYEAQLLTVERQRSTATALAAALRSRSPVGLRGRVVAFEEAARTGATLAAQRAQIAAVKAYNARAAKLGVLTSEVRRELTRLAP